MRKESGIFRGPTWVGLLRPAPCGRNSAPGQGPPGRRGEGDLGSLAPGPRTLGLSFAHGQRSRAGHVPTCGLPKHSPIGALMGQASPRVGTHAPDPLQRSQQLVQRGAQALPASLCRPDPNPSPSRPSFQGLCVQRTREGHGPVDDGRGSQGQGWASSVSRSPSFHQVTWALS